MLAVIDEPGTSIAKAAHEMGVNPSTIRRWIATGAPVLRSGSSGRGRGARVVVADLKRWRAGVDAASNAEFLEKLGAVLLDFHRLNTGINEPAHRSIGIGDCKAAALLCTLFSYVAVRLTGEEIRHAAVGTLEAIARADARFSSNRSETFDRNQA